MSGPKGYNAGLSPRIRRERELEARRRTWERVVEQCEELELRRRVGGPTTSVWDALAAVGYGLRRLRQPTDADLDAVEELQRAQSAVVDSVERELVEVATARSASALAALQRELATTTDFVVTALASSPERGATARSAPSGDLIALLGETGDRQEELTREVERLLVDGRGADRRVWLELASRVSAAVRQEQDRCRRVRLREELEAIVARIDGPAARALLDRLASAPDSNAVEALRPTVVEAVRRAELEDERAFVIAQAADAWRELGYETGPEFAELALAGDAALLTRRGWSDHALQVRFDADGLGMATNVVAVGESSAVRDNEIEVEHCADAAGLTEALAIRGVDVVLTRRVEPGALPMQRLNAEQAAARRHRTARTQGAGS